MKGSYLIALAGLALVMGSTGASACDETDELYRRGFYPEYIEAMKVLSEAGDTECQFRLGTVYRDGILVQKDTGMALAWYRLAAARGHPFAQFELGTMYDTGDGVPQDYREAATWYAAAADQGFPMAQLNLSVLYEDGLGVPRDAEQAKVLYLMSMGRKSDEF